MSWRCCASSRGFPFPSIASASTAWSMRRPRWSWPAAAITAGASSWRRRPASTGPSFMSACSAAAKFSHPALCDRSWHGESSSFPTSRSSSASASSSTARRAIRARRRRHHRATAGHHRALARVAGAHAALSRQDGRQGPLLHSRHSRETEYPGLVTDASHVALGFPLSAGMTEEEGRIIPLVLPFTGASRYDSVMSRPRRDLCALSGDLWNSSAIIDERLSAAGGFSAAGFARGERAFERWWLPRASSGAPHIANYRRLIGKDRAEAHLVMNSLSPSMDAEIPRDATHARARLPQRGGAGMMRKLLLGAVALVIGLGGFWWTQHDHLAAAADAERLGRAGAGGRRPLGGAQHAALSCAASARCRPTIR